MLQLQSLWMSHRKGLVGEFYLKVIPVNYLESGAAGMVRQKVPFIYS